MAKSSLIIKRYETAPSAIKSNTATILVLHSPDVMGCAVPFLALWTLLVFGIAIYCPLSPGCVPEDAPWWLIPAIYLMGSMGLFCWIAVIRTNKVMSFDFSRKCLLRWYYSETAKKFLSQELPFDAFDKITIHFEKAHFSDDSDIWEVSLTLKSGASFSLLKTSQEESAFKVVRRLVQDLGLPLVDPLQLFPFEKTRQRAERGNENIPAISSSSRLAIQRTASGLSLEQKQQAPGCFVAFMTLFTVIWCGGVLMGTFSFWNDGETGDTPFNPYPLIIGAVFFLVFGGFGLVLLLLTLWFHFGRIFLHLNGGQLILEERMLRRTMQRKTIAVTSILKTEIISGDDQTNCLKVYASDNDSVLIFGTGFSIEELTWIQQQIQRAAGIE